MRPTEKGRGFIRLLGCGMGSLGLSIEEDRIISRPAKNKSLQKGANGSLTLYVGVKSPGADKESNWLPAPNSHFSL